jgi:hypothetical protein
MIHRVSQNLLCTYTAVVPPVGSVGIGREVLLVGVEGHLLDPHILGRLPPTDLTNPKAEIGNCRISTIPPTVNQAREKPKEIHWTLTTSNSILLLAVREFLLVRMKYRLLKRWII